MENSVYIFLMLIGSGLSAAWYSKYSNNDVYGGWLPNRRSSMCSRGNEECLSTDNCCSKYDYCVRLIRGGEIGSGECKPLGKYPKWVFEGKQEGQQCRDSFECESGCCHEVQRLRYGSILTCGNPESHSCVTRKEINKVFKGFKPF